MGLSSFLFATSEYLLQSGFVSSRHLLCCMAKNLCVADSCPCTCRSQYVFGRLNHAGQHVLQKGIGQSKLRMGQGEERRYFLSEVDERGLHISCQLGVS